MCNSEPVPFADSTDARTAEEVSLKPSTATNILVGNIPRLSTKCPLHVEAMIPSARDQAPIVNAIPKRPSIRPGTHVAADKARVWIAFTRLPLDIVTGY